MGDGLGKRDVYYLYDQKKYRFAWHGKHPTQIKDVPSLAEAADIRKNDLEPAIRVETI